MTAHLLAKLTPKGIPMDGGIGGIPELTPQDVAGYLAGCEQGPYLAILSKYTGDCKARRQLEGLVSSIVLSTMIREEWNHPNGDIMGSRLVGQLVTYQFIARDRLSGQRRAKAIKIPKHTYYRSWRKRIDALERDLLSWEADGIAYLRHKMSLE